MHNVPSSCVLFISLPQVDLLGMGERTKDVIVDESLQVAQLPRHLDGSLIPVQVTQVKITYCGLGNVLSVSPR